MATETKPDYYKILGVSKNASFEQIKERYRILALKFHPDKEKSTLAGEIMVVINEAYEVLSNPEKRRAYDNNGSYNYTPEQNPTSDESLGKKQTKSQFYKDLLSRLGRHTLSVLRQIALLIEKAQEASTRYNEAPSDNFQERKSSHSNRDYTRRNNYYKTRRRAHYDYDDSDNEHDNFERVHKTRVSRKNKRTKDSYSDPWKETLREDERIANEIFDTGDSQKSRRKNPTKGRDDYSTSEDEYEKFFKSWYS